MFNFKTLDENTKFIYKDDTYRQVYQHKYFYVSELVYNEYCIKKQTSTTVGKMVNRNRHWVTTHCNIWGFPVETVGGHRFVRFSKMTALHILGYTKRKTNRAVAEIFNCDTGTVRKIKKGLSPYNY